jgi:integrase
VGHVADLWERTVDGRRVRTDRYGAGRRWLARYEDPDGRPRSKAFARKLDAERFLATVETDKLRGTFLDPDAGRIRVSEFAAAWLEAQTFDPSTRETVASRLRCHIEPAFGDSELRDVRPSHVQAWLRGLQRDLAPTYVRVLLANLSSILSAAVEDGLIARNPCRAGSAVKAPSVPSRKIVPWPTSDVLAVVDTLPERYAATALVAAGCGLRQGEVFGLTPDAVDVGARRLAVEQQIKIVQNRLVLAPPKRGKTREVPLPEAVAAALIARMKVSPPLVVELPWLEPDGPVRTTELIFCSREHAPVNRNYFNQHIWKPALRDVGIATTRANGMHALRHYFASVLLDAGESIRTVSDYLGHADPGFTLRTYTHLVPSSEGRARTAVDKALRQAR